MVVGLFAVMGGSGWGVWRHFAGERSVTEPEDRIERAWRRVHAEPRVAEAWIALGDVQAAADQSTGAEHAYRTALRLEGEGGLAYARLGFLLYARGRDDEARALLAEAKRRGARAPMLDHTLDRLRPSTRPERAAVPTEPDAGPAPVAPSPVVRSASVDAGAPLDAGVSGGASPELEETDERESRPPECALEAVRRGRHGTYVLPVFVDGVASELVIDTGASMTVVTEEMAWRAGLFVDPRRVVRAITANGRVDFPTARVPWFEIGGRVAKDVRVAVCADCVQGYADGLLGLDLLSVLGLEFRLSEGTVHLLDCE